MNLTDYITDTQSLMRDMNALLTPENQLIRWINNARYDICLRTGCIEVLVSGNCPAGSSSVPGYALPNAAQPGNNLAQAFQTIAEVEMYSYGYANQFIKANNTGVKGIIEIKQVAISWGSFRPAIDGCRGRICRHWRVRTILEYLTTQLYGLTKAMVSVERFGCGRRRVFLVYQVSLRHRAKWSGYALAFL